MCGMEVSNKPVTFVAYCLLQSSAEIRDRSRRATNSVALIASIWTLWADRMLSYTLMKWKWNESPLTLGKSDCRTPRMRGRRLCCLTRQEVELFGLIGRHCICLNPNTLGCSVLMVEHGSRGIPLLSCPDLEAGQDRETCKRGQIQIHLWPNTQNRNDCPLSSAKSWKMLEWLWYYASAGWPSDQSFQALV